MTPDPETVSPDLLARSAFVRMRSDGFRHLLVEEGEKLVGIVTDRDLRRPDVSDEPDGWNRHYDLDSEYTVHDIMTRDPGTVRVDDRLETALNIFVERKFGALPVLDLDGQLVGILTTDDALRAFVTVMKKAGPALRRNATEKAKKTKKGE